MHILYFSLLCVLVLFACFHVSLLCYMFGVVEFIKHELSGYVDQTCFIPFLGEWRKREDGKRYTVYLNGYQLTPVFVTPNFKISLGKGQDESGGQIQISEGIGDLEAWEMGKEGRKGGRGSLIYEHLLFCWHHEFCPFSSVWARALLSLTLFLSAHLLLFLPRKGGGGLWFIPLSFLPDFHKEETQRCLQDSARSFPLFLNNDL